MNSQALYAHSDPGNHQRSDMLIEVDFKWLMAGIGCWIDPERLRVDPAYAHAKLQRALTSDCEPLRRCAAGLKAELEGLGAALTHGLQA